jgi:NTE family protein
MSQRPSIQRALVLQGEGALGAYEAGVFAALPDKFHQQDDDNNSQPLFDIVAGTSIGAINAAIIVSSVKEEMEKGTSTQKESWKNSAENLKKFWNHLSVPTPRYILEGPLECSSQ